MKDDIRIIVFKNGETVMDEINPLSLIVSLTKKEDASKKVNQQMAIVGDPRDVFIANMKLHDHVQQIVLKKMKENLEEDPDDPIARSLLKLIKLMDSMTPHQHDDEPDCEDCPAKDECDESEYIPVKGKCA